MKKIKDRNFFLLMAGLGVLILLFLLIVLFGNEQDEKTVKVGFVMSGSREESGWNGAHYRGMLQVCEEYGIELLVKENIKEFTGQCEVAIEELVAEGAGMIVLNSYGYSEEVKEFIAKYPEVTFYVNSSEYHDENMTSYFARIYQGRYLAGMIAGMKTESDKIGYVAAMPNNEVNRGINAFTLGVRRVNKEAEVIVAWTGSWDDSQAEREAAAKLIEDCSVDVLTYHQNQNYVIQAAEEAGVYSIGYHEKFEGFSPRYLTAVVCDWYPVYKELIKEYMKGKGNINTNYWIGVEKAAVNLAAYSSEVTEDIVKEIEAAREEILEGRAVFAGEIYDTEGVLRCEENEVLSDEMLLEEFDWFVEGVEFYE